jgi:CheY-like chemotaxis protein
MAITIGSRSIKRISIIDDDAQAREVSEYSVEELGLEPLSEAGPFDLLSECVDAIRQRADAAICDYNLKVRDYSSFNGAELTAAFYEARFPAVLCTKWHTASIDEMRRFRRFIPLLVDPARLNPDSIIFGIEACIREFGGEFLTARRPWRALVRIEDIRTVEQGAKFVYVVVPAWNSNEVVKLPSEIMPPGILERLGPGSRLHAKVNLGANGNEELFFEEWEA